MQNIATVTTEVVALRAAEGQRKSKTRRFSPLPRPAEHVSLSFGIIIGFIRDDCESPRIKVFDVTTGAKTDWGAKKKKKKKKNAGKCLNSTAQSESFLCA